MDATGGSIHILHVDDEPDFAGMAADFLEREDDRFTVTTATSASEGFDLLGDHEIDCVVSDYDMPGTDGIEFLEAVRGEYPDLPVILFTGKGSEEVASDAIAAGATDYLQKERGTDQYELLANRVRNAVDRYRGQQRAAELDRVRTLASDVNQALVRATSREEAETSVCEIITDSDPYLFAWIGGVDPETGRIEPRASAGIGTDYLDEITVTADDGPTGRGPGGTAIRERRVVVSQNIQDDPAFGPWREEALERGFRAVAAVPLEYQETLYGELAVYAGRPDAFDDDERELLAELGDDIAHALHGFETRVQLREERDRRQALFENAPGPVILGEVHGEDANHRIVEVNDAFESVFGYDAEEVRGMDVTEVIIPEEDMAAYGEFRERALAGETITAEVERVTADGPREFLMHVIPYGTDADRAHGTYVWYTDITEREKRERAIEALHATARAFMGAETTEGVADIAVDAVRDILEMPASSIHLYDGDEEGLVPVAWTNRTEEIVGDPPTFAPGEGIAGTAFETGEAQIHDDISTVPGRYNPDTDVRSQIALPLGDHGVLLIGSPESGAFDETDVSLARTLAATLTTALTRLTREQTLHQTRERYRTLVDHFPGGGVFLYDADLRCILAGGQGLSGVGLTPDGIEGERPHDRYPDAIADELETHLRNAFGGEEAEFEQRYRGRHYQIRVLPIGDDTITNVMAVSRDITDHKERERELERRTEELEAVTTRLEEQYRTLFEEAPVMAVVTRDEDDRPIIEDCNTQFLDTLGYEKETVLGSELATHYTPASRERLLDERGYDRSLEGEFTREHRELLTAEGEVVEALLRAVPRRDADGDVVGTMAMYVDITEQEAVKRANERLEEFTGIVSHDLRNPLNVAQGRLELARAECDSEHLDSVARAHERMAFLIDDLLTLARQGEDAIDVEPIRLADSSDACWENVETTDATLVVDTDLTLDADRSQLQQLLENLYRNAVEHGGKDVTVTVGGLDDGFYVADDGPGIPPDEREDVFDTGYSTRQEGTGFGLSIVQEIVEAHGWEISVTDSEAGGARFEITGIESAQNDTG